MCHLVTPYPSTRLSPSGLHNLEHSISHAGSFTLSPPPCLPTSLHSATLSWSRPGLRYCSLNVYLDIYAAGLQGQRTTKAAAAQTKCYFSAAAGDNPAEHTVECIKKIMRRTRNLGRTRSTSLQKNVQVMIEACKGLNLWMAREPCTSEPHVSCAVNFESSQESAKCSKSIQVLLTSANLQGTISSVWSSPAVLKSVRLKGARGIVSMIKKNELPRSTYEALASTRARESFVNSWPPVVQASEC